MFELENAITKWKRRLRRNPAFEDGDVAELESHLREEIGRLKAGGLSEEEAFQKTVDRIGEPETIGDELYKSRATQKAGPTPPWKQKSLLLSLLPNYITVARRTLLNNKLYTGINILGLSIGIICCLLIYLFVQNELKYDRFHEKSDRIYRVVRIMDADTDPRKVGITSAPFGDALANDFPEMVQEATRLMPADGLVEIGDKKFMENRLYITDANVFRVFSWPLVKGDPETALQRPHTVVLSETVARKYFGSANPLGRTLRVDGETEFEITGVFRKPVDYNSHIDFDLLASMETFRNAEFYGRWWWNTLHTYVLLAPRFDPQDLEDQLPVFMDKYFGEDMARNNRRIGLALQPLGEIYFADDTTFDWQVSHGSKAVLYMFGIVALLIIVVACVNFVNMATARSINRAREIGIRKTLGAQRFNLLIQFLGEALMITFAAGLASFAAVYSMLPRFEQLLGKLIAIDLLSVEVIAATVVILVITGLLAGTYPALFLSSFQPIKALKEKISFGSSQVLVRKGLIVFQFAVSSLLIIGTLIVNRQLDYVAGKSLGFQPDQLLNIAINNNDIVQHLEPFMEEIERLPSVKIASVLSGTPGGFFDNYRFRAGENWDETHTLKTLYADYNFTEVLGLEMLAGRDFDPSFSTDSAGAVVINKAAADRFGWTPEEALGKRFENQFRDSTVKKVIGVVENFNYESLHQPIAPLVVSMNQDRREILVNVDTEHISETLAAIEERWNEFSPLYPMEYFFLDQQFARLYENDRRQRAVFSGFSLMAIFIACMGLFSLAAFNAEKRNKEMGIRKVLGATFSDILLLFNREVFGVVIVSFLLAVPVGYMLAERWLQDYAYRIPNGVSNYLLAGLIIVFLSVLTVSYQSVKVALTNPVDSLRSE
ncbi:MAG: ABC transporter permease [Balneolaceae bacterium]|nr:ABC transporter permease [Balneolaceae bacterium]